MVNDEADMDEQREGQEEGDRDGVRCSVGERMDFAGRGKYVCVCMCFMVRSA